MPRHGAEEPADDNELSGRSVEVLFEETPGFSFNVPVRPHRRLLGRRRGRPLPRRALFSAVTALVVATAGLAVLVGAHPHPQAPASPSSPTVISAPLAVGTLPSGCSFHPIDGTHSLAECVHCDPRFSVYGLLCHFREEVVVRSVTPKG
jgi:hypothetical protein